MLRTGIVRDAAFLEHDTGPGHPERAERLRALARILEATPRPGLVPIAARDARRDELLRVHTPEHVDRVEATAGRARDAFDADTPTSARSYEAAVRAAGGVIALVDAIASGTVDNGFALVRPPGHHAERLRPMGFCLFNNVALAAAHLRARHGFERILVVDWDVHHGNGTQHAFWRDPSVLFLSSHQYPFYPGTGGPDDVGEGEGEGFTLNLPFPGGYGDRQYVEAYLEVVEPVARSFRPDFVLVSAGFDAHRRDPLAGMEMSEAGFAALARIVLRVARDHCSNRLAAVLEGGYDLTGLTRSVDAVLGEMSGQSLDEPVSPPEEGGKPSIGRALEIARHYWRI